MKYETCNLFLELKGYSVAMASWSFLTNHARALLCIAHDPGARLRDIAAKLDVTERSAHAIVTDLVDAGYVIKDRDGRRNRYRIQGHLPLRDPISAQRPIGEMLDLLVGDERTPGRSPRGIDR
ncbi:MAG TPA: helix-turn-helix domain-containing protein [Jiangellaceae bacterium]